MKEIYLDNSATTKVCDEAANKIYMMLTQKYGNPSSLHGKGFEAEREVELAREIIAKEINADSNEIYFTSGGTEANNLAILGSVAAKKKLGNKIITTSFEHSSVYESFKYLENKGFEVVYINPDKNGDISREQIIEALDENTILVSIMMVNNEVGTILPIDCLKESIKVKAKNATFHVDAVQAFGKLKINVRKIGVDLLSVSAHKVNGPKGCGALYKSRNTRIEPIMYGGEQQSKIRPGTECAPLIAGFGEAVKNFNIDDSYLFVKELNEYCRKKLSYIDGIGFNSQDTALPYILNFFNGKIKSETMLHYLSSNNIFVSSGSACSKGKQSRVLKSMQLDKKIIDTSLRLSFSRYNTKNDIDIFIDKLQEGLQNLAKA